MSEKYTSPFGPLLIKSARQFMGSHNLPHTHLSDAQIESLINEADHLFNELGPILGGSATMGWLCRAVVEADPNRKQISLSN